MDKHTGSKQQNQGQNKFLDAALWYEKQGLCVIPCKPRSKESRLLDSWTEYQSRRSTEEELHKWWGDWPTANPAIVLGEVSGLVVLDVDDEEAIKEYPIPVTAQAISGSGKPHYYFRYIKGMRNYKRTNGSGGEQFSIRGDGEIIVAPGSIHPNGKPYRWTKGLRLDEVKIADLPEWMIELTMLNDEEEEAAAYYKKHDSKLADGLKEYIQTLKEQINFSDLVEQEGVKLTERHKRYNHFDNPWGTSKGGKCFTVWIEENVATHWHEDKGKRSYDIIRFIRKLKNLGFKEAVDYLADYAETERFDFGLLKQSKKASQADLLVQLIEGLPVTLFPDEYGEPYARFKVGNHFEIRKLRSKYFKRWLSQAMWDAEKKVPNSDSINSALNVIEAKACYKGEARELHNRVAWHDGAIWYDLGNWKAVKITADGYETVDDPPTIFRKYAHQRTQAAPEGTDIRELNKLNKFINLKKEEDGLLFLAGIVCSFIPDIPHPVETYHGGQGAAKTTSARLKKALVDPSETRTVTCPHTPAEFVQMVSHNWCLILDNLTGISDWLSDAMCRAVTGDGFSKRELYSDDDDVVYKFMRCLSITGINLIPTKPDLLDRSLIFELEAIPESSRKEEKRFWEEFEEVKPKILGALFTLVSKTLKCYSEIKLARKPRMADFATWGSAMAKALGKKPEDFIAAYYNNIKVQNEEAVDASPVARVIIAFMDGRKEWEGSASALLEKLNEVAEEIKVDMKDRRYPKDARWLWRRITEVKSNLLALGIQATNDGSTGKKAIKLAWVKNEPPDDPEGSKFQQGQKNDDSDDSANSGELANDGEIDIKINIIDTEKNDDHSNPLESKEKIDISTESSFYIPSRGNSSNNNFEGGNSNGNTTHNTLQGNENDDYDEMMIKRQQSQEVTAIDINLDVDSVDQNDDLKVYAHSNTCDCELCIPPSDGLDAEAEVKEFLRKTGGDGAAKSENMDTNPPKDKRNGSFEMVGAEARLDNGQTVIQKFKGRAGHIIFKLAETQEGGVRKGPVIKWIYPSDRRYSEIAEKWETTNN